MGCQQSYILRLCGYSNQWRGRDGLVLCLLCVSLHSPVSGHDPVSLTLFRLTFTSGKAKGKIMLVQSVNTGSDLADNQFDLQIPGGGEGIFDGCSSEFGGIAGARYGGISSRSDCNSMPAKLQPGCQWRFDWFNDADNPTHSFTQIQCPTALTNITGCKRSDDASFPVFSTPSITTWSAPTPTETAAAWGQCDSLTWDVAMSVSPSTDIPN